MSYAVKEIFYSIQGEGANVGRSAVFCRFAGCNLWSGREEDRASAICRFCDTDFIGGNRYETASELAEAIGSLWPSGERNHRFVIFTGGEPLLQLDSNLVSAVRLRWFDVAIETNGTKPLPCLLDWVCVSPKAGAELAVTAGDELKLVYPQDGVAPERFAHLPFEYFFLQPMDGPEREMNTRKAVEYCLANPKWRLSLQTHKYLGIR